MVRSAPPLAKFPILTFALESMEILNDLGLAADDFLACAIFSKMVSVSGIFFRGLVFCVFLNDNPFYLK